MANDVSQNARKTCPQFKDEFFPAIESSFRYWHFQTSNLKINFRHAIELKNAKEVEHAIGKLINVWKDRQIFTPSQCKRLHEVHQQVKLSGSFPTPAVANKEHGKVCEFNKFQKNAKMSLRSLNLVSSSLKKRKRMHKMFCSV